MIDNKYLNDPEKVIQIYSKTIEYLLNNGKTFSQIYGSSDQELSKEVAIQMDELVKADFNLMFEEIVKQSEECSDAEILKTKQSIKNLEKQIEALKTLDGMENQLKEKEKDLAHLNGILKRKQTCKKIYEKQMMEYIEMEDRKNLSKLYPITVNFKTFSIIASQLRRQLVDTYPEWRKAKMISSFKKETSYSEALHLAENMFNTIYETANANYSARQLLHTLINVKRGIYGKTREAQTLLSIVGPQGVGKTVFAECIYEAVHKEQCRLGTLSLTSLVGRSISQMGNDYLVVINEKAFFDRNNANALKDLITGETYTYTPLYSNPIERTKTAQIITTSNSDMSDTFWVDGSSRRLSQIDINGIKKQLTREQLISILEKIWEVVPVDFPYDPIQFVKEENINHENRESEDDIFENFLTHEKTDFISYASRYHTVSDYMGYLEIKTRDKVRGYLNNPEYFEKKIIHKTNCYKPTEKYFNEVIDTIDLTSGVEE